MAAWPTLPLPSTSALGPFGSVIIPDFPDLFQSSVGIGFGFCGGVDATVSV
jgi:hypothetical protein